MDPTEISYEDFSAEAAIPLITIDEVRKGKDSIEIS